MGKKSRKSASVPPKRSAPLVPPSPGALDAIAEEASRPPSRTPSTSGPGLLDALDRKMEQDVEAALLTAASESLSRIDAALDFSEDEEESEAIIAAIITDAKQFVELPKSDAASSEPAGADLGHPRPRQDQRQQEIRNLGSSTTDASSASSLKLLLASQ